MGTYRIEILPASSLDARRPLVEDMRRTASLLGVGLGCKYLLDLRGSADLLQRHRGQQVLDAGAGVGVMQRWLSAQRTDLLSVDLNDRASLAPHFRAWCRVRELHPGDLEPSPSFSLRNSLTRHPRRWPGQIRRAIFRPPGPPRDRGTITVWQRDLGRLPDVPDASLDAAVSISALEHNEPAALRRIADELLRIMRLGGRLMARGNLAEFYCRSGDNGMPWGKWDPGYEPVGILRVKR